MIEFGAYEVIAQVATGSTATVYKARHREINQTAAIKELNAELLGSPETIARFRAEAHVLAGFDDPHIVTVYDFVEEPDRSWIAEEWVDGLTIEALLGAHGPLTAEQSLGVLRGALLGLSYAHDRGIVHGDLAPSNIIADRAGTSKLIDFGVSAPVGSTGLRGTPAYMSPEAARGEPVGKPGDVYSAGAVLFALLMGHIPFPAHSVEAVLRAHIEQPAPTLSGHGPAMAALLTESMAKDANARPPDARAFLARLDEAASARYGAAWLERASIVGAVGAVTTASGVAAGVAASGSAASTAAAAPTVFVQSAAATGGALKPVRRIASLSRSQLLIAATAAGVLVVGGGVAIALTAGGADPKASHSDANSQVALGQTVSASAPSSSAAPAPVPVPVLASVPLGGVYRIRIVVTSTNFAGEKVGPQPSTNWTIKLTCGASSCRGSVKSSSGNTFQSTFDGTSFNVSSVRKYRGPCVFASGPNKGKNAPGTLYATTVTTSVHASVTTRSNGPIPAAGTATLITGSGHAVEPRGKVIKGSCHNNGRVYRDAYTMTLTYVSG